MSTKSVSRVVALEEAFLHPRVWDLFPEPLQRKYQPVRARLSDVGAERIRLMDAAGIDVQVLSHVQPGIQMLADEQAELAIAVSREVNDWLARRSSRTRPGSRASPCCRPSHRLTPPMSWSAPFATSASKAR